MKRNTAYLGLQKQNLHIVGKKQLGLTKLNLHNTNFCIFKWEKQLVSLLAFFVCFVSGSLLEIWCPSMLKKTGFILILLYLFIINFLKI